MQFVIFFFLLEIFLNRRVFYSFIKNKKWFLSVILSLCSFLLFFYFIFFLHLSFLDLLGEKETNSWKRICLRFYRTEGLGGGGSATLAVSLGTGCSPLWETHSSSKQVTGMRLGENRLQFPSLLQKWKIEGSRFLHVANLKCFSSGLPGADRACLSISGSQVELQAQSQVQSFPQPWLQLSIL